MSVTVTVNRPSDPTGPQTPHPGHPEPPHQPQSPVHELPAEVQLEYAEHQEDRILDAVEYAAEAVGQALVIQLSSTDRDVQALDHALVAVGNAEEKQDC